jgi:hypothetical protein
MEFLDIIRKEGTLKKSLIIATGLAKDYAQMYHAGEWNPLARAIVSDSKPKFTRRRDGQPVTPGCFIRTQGYKVYWYKFRSIEHAKAFTLASQQQISKQDRWSMNGINAFTLDIGILETIDILKEANSPFTHTKEAFESLRGHVAGLQYGI